MIQFGAAMTKTGAATLIKTLIGHLGEAAPRALLAALFLVALATTSVISNKARVLLFFPIDITTTGQIGASALPFIVGLAIASHAALATHVATRVNLMVIGRSGYKFWDYTEFGFLLAIWWLVVTVFIVPLYWRF